MTRGADDRLRRAAAHVLVDDVVAPVLSDRDAHHVFRVLRVADGAMVTVTDGAGAWRECRAVQGERIEPVADVVVEAEPAEPVELFVAVPKQDRPDWIVQKATELGVERLVFLHADRSVVRWDADRASRRMAKLRVVADEALMQCRRVRRLELAGPVASTTVLGTVPVAEPGGRPLDRADRRLAIGPEGGWSVEELEVSADRIAVGRHVLRVETAALAAAVLLTAARTVV